MKKLLAAGAIVLALSSVTSSSPVNLSIFESLGDDNFTSYIEADIVSDVSSLTDEVMSDSDYNEAAWEQALEVVNQQLEDQFNEILAAEQEEE